MKVQTQWIVKPMGGLLGLNYQSVAFTFKIYEVKNEREIFDGLRVMENEVLAYCAEQKKG